MGRTDQMMRPALLVFLAGCAATPRPSAGDDESVFGPLEVGMVPAALRRVTAAPYLSRVHGERWVHVYVNEVGADAYVGGGQIPVGTVVVKASWERASDGTPSDVEGPIFVMEKRSPGYAPEHDDWWYAIHWADPTPTQRARLGGPIYWRGRSPKVAYCADCHDSYDRGLGGLVPSSVLDR